MLKSIAVITSMLLATPAFAQDTVVDTVTTSQISVLPMHVGGKVRKEAMGYSYQWPGVYFEARFSGPFVNLLFDDEANNFNVMIDGELLMVVHKPGHRTITIQAPGAGAHTVRLEKRSETQYATGHFMGFLGQPATTPVAPLEHQIEFIGDSTTVGYGNTSPYTQCTVDEIFETTDSQQGFGPVVARHFRADYQINAFSGLGMVRNYDGHEHPKYHLPMLYPRAIFDDPAPAKQEGWHPQIIVVGIGGNDFSTALHADEPWKTREELIADYTKTYVAFIKRLRADNPDAHLVIASPAPDRAEYTQAVKDVFNAVKALGETRIDLVTLPKTVSDGCNGHPNTRDDANIAKMYIAFLEAHPGYWQGK